ncbi:MAG: fibronectin type III domain-containing protein [Bacteroidales bacterium]|nr:fibronectin type III domain-containing protein [Bacteroidales bacterium]
MKDLIYISILFIFFACEKDDTPAQDINNPDIEKIEIPKPGDLSTYPMEEEIYVSWSTVTEATSYHIFWTDDNSDPGINSNKITNSPNPYFADTYLNHKNLDPAKTYKYRVQAVKDESTSPLSDMVYASPLLASLLPPENAMATAGTSAITISWDAANTAGITYSIDRKEATGYFSELVTGLSATEYSDNTIEIGKGYYYRIIAHDDASSRTSEASETCYAAISRTLYEQERNNDNITSSLQFSTHYWDADDRTLDLDKYHIEGGYSGTYSIYSAASYRNFDADCFNLDLESGDVIEFNLISGNMSDLWSMNVGLRVYVKSTSGTYSDGEIYSFNSPSDSYTFNYSVYGTLIGVYLDISIWDDLINYGPYSYEIEISINRKE